MLSNSCELLVGPTSLSDGDRGRLYGPPGCATVGGPRMQAKLATQARAAGLQVVQLGSQLVQDFALQRLRLDHLPFDRHWSRCGQAVAAAAARQPLSNHCRLTPGQPARAPGPSS